LPSGEMLTMPGLPVRPVDEPGDLHLPIGGRPLAPTELLPEKNRSPHRQQQSDYDDRCDALIPLQLIENMCALELDAGRISVELAADC